MLEHCLGAMIAMLLCWNIAIMFCCYVGTLPWRNDCADDEPTRPFFAFLAMLLYIGLNSPCVKQKIYHQQDRQRQCSVKRWRQERCFDEDLFLLLIDSKSSQHTTTSTGQRKSDTLIAFTVCTNITPPKMISHKEKTI